MASSLTATDKQTEIDWTDWLVNVPLKSTATQEGWGHMDQSCESPLITSETWVRGCHVMQSMCVSDCLSVPAESDGVAESAGSQHRQDSLAAPEQ